MEILALIKWLWNQVYHWDIWKNQLFLNTLGGIFAAIALFVLQKIYKYWRSRRIKYLLGMDADKKSEFHIAYAKLALPTLYQIVDDKTEIIFHPYFKPKKRKDRKANFSMEYPVSSCEVRALKYITSSLLNQLLSKSKLVADIDECVDEALNISFVSLGGRFSNYKTEDLLSNESNIFLNMGDDNFFNLDGKPILKNFKKEHDYGIIIRIRPKEFSKRVWIACAGLGEWGTSGSAWFLSNKYSELLKEIKNPINFLALGKGKDFAALIEIKEGQDESAKLVKLFKCQKDIEDFISNQKNPSVDVTPNDSGSIPNINLAAPPTSSNSPSPMQDSTSASTISITVSGIVNDKNDKKEE